MEIREATREEILAAMRQAHAEGKWVLAWLLSTLID